MRTIILPILALLALAHPARAQYRTRFPLPAPEVSASLGVNIHFTNPRPGEVEQIAKAGFRWVRMDFGWAGIERVKGEYDFSHYDTLMAALRPHHIRPIFILDYGNDLYQQGSPRSDSARSAFARFAAAAVTHFRGQGVVWEMYNEPNIGFWRPQPNVDEYAALALETGRAIRQAAPEEWYVGPGVSQIDLSFIEKCLKEGLLRYWDAVSVHPYREGAIPETVESEYRALRTLIARYAPAGKTIPIINSEWGYSELYHSMNLEMQGKFIVREALVNLSQGLPISIYYDWHDDGSDPKEVEHHFGTVYPDYKPKPAYQAMFALTQTLGGYRFNKRLTVGGSDDYCLLLTKGPLQAIALWTTASRPHTLRLPSDVDEWVRVGYLGDRDILKTNGSLTVTVGDTPTYLLPARQSRLWSLAATWESLPPSFAPADANETRALLGHLREVPASKKSPRMTAELVTADPDAIYSRSEEPITLRTRLTTGPTPVTFTQETAVVSRWPLGVSIEPFPDGGILAQVRNPSRRAFEGELAAETDHGEVYSPVHVAQGLSEWPVPLDKRMVGAGMRLMENRPGSLPPVCVLKIPAVRLTWLDDFRSQTKGEPPKGYEAVPDGDPKIGSTIVARMETAPGWPAFAEKLDPKTPPILAVRIDYKFEPGWKFLRFAPKDARPLPGKPAALGMMVYAGKSGDVLNMRFVDSTGQTFQPTAGRLDWSGWKHVTFPLKSEGSGHWGGANDGVIHYPIRIDSLFLIDSAHRGETKGTLYVTGAVLQEK